ncbi:riboflavin synthase [Haloarchaeobius litoreus]|uniref:Riboflavin synthase n=1 Tax=Haloarchaeobius litoreus TaxID=755306 RepID=A0ABD6DM24_9EURY|nr:riboflavin synthase [Haloarchaeobius litoreus]
MYTGVVPGTGRVTASEPVGEGHELRIETNGHVDPAPGDSVAVDGVCLTATAVSPDCFEAYCSGETVARTLLADRPVGTAVNLEPPLTLSDGLDGHLVRGCVETTTELLAVESTGTGWRYEFAVRDGFTGLLVEKGGVAVDGVSLTVADLETDRFAVAVIPETRERTTLAGREPGERVHLEADPVAKYVARQAHVAGERST